MSGVRSQRNPAGWAIVLVAIALTAPSACGNDEPSVPAAAAGRESSGGEAGSAAGSGGSGATPTTYACKGGFVYEPSGGASFAGAGGVDTSHVVEIPWTGGSGQEMSCVVGEAYCRIQSVPEVEIGVPPTVSCKSLNGPLSACAHNPNCECICAHGGCGLPCSCTDTDGLATVSCQEN